MVATNLRVDTNIQNASSKKLADLRAFDGKL